MLRETVVLCNEIGVGKGSENVIVMRLIFLFLLITCSTGNAQDKIPTPQEAEKFFNDADVMLGEIQTYFENEPFYSTFSKSNVGDIVITGSNMYKVLAIENVMVQDCGMLLFNTEKLSFKEINTLRKSIIAKYKSGISFGDLVAKYKNDAVKGIESYDVIIHQQTTEFQEALKKHNRGDIFAVDVPNTNNCSLVFINGNALKTRTASVRHLVYE